MYGNKFTAKIWGIHVLNIVCRAAYLFITLEQCHICELFILCGELIPRTFMYISFNHNMGYTVLKIYVRQLINLLHFDSVIFVRYLLIMCSFMLLKFFKDIKFQNICMEITCAIHVHNIYEEYM